MSPVILVITQVLLALPVGFFIAAMMGARFHIAPCLIVTIVYAWIWLRFRPGRFVVQDQSLEVIWPLKRREISRDSISDIRLLDRGELKQTIGWAMRVGAGGLGGGFGWLWTRQHGIVQMYVSRTDQFVWIERKNDRHWLITPEYPEKFVAAMLN